MDRFSPSLSPDSEFMELLWQNGQIVMQGQSSRPRKSSIPASSSQHTKLQEKEGRDSVLPKINRVGVMDSAANEFSPAGTSSQMGSSTQDDENDMVPWLSYPIDEYYCLEFLSDFSGSNTATLPVHGNSLHVDKGGGSTSCSQVVRDSHGSDQNASPKASNRGSSGTGRIRNVQFNLMPQQGSGSVSPSRSRTPDIAAKITTGLPDAKLQRQHPVSPKLLPSPPPAPTGNPGLLNFSHFARPAALLKANLQSSDNRMRSNERASNTTASTAPLESMLKETSEDLKGVSRCQTAVVSDKGDSKSTPQPQPEHVCVNHSEAANWEDASRDNKIGASKSRSPELVSVKASLPGSRHVISENSAPVVASSVCSASGAHDNTKHRDKRKIQEGEEYGCQSEDLEDESAAAKKMPSARGTPAKRSRAAEAHNLSERRRRDRINEKMRALQELIPNCNKADKASMLDEAIEYLKTLKLQVQIMSMGSGLCMPPMMLPPGMQQLRAHHMPHFPPVGMGYRMGMLDMNGSPMIPMPPMHGMQFPCSVPGNPVMPGMAGANGLQMFGIPGQGHLVPMSTGPDHVPPIHSMRVNTMPEASGMRDVSLKDAGKMSPFTGLKDQQMQKLNSGGHNRVEHHDTHIPTSSQATKECPGDSSSMQIMTNASQSSDEPSNSLSGNRNSSTGTSGSLG